MKNLFCLVFVGLFALPLGACGGGGGGGAGTGSGGGGAINKGPLAPFAGGAANVRQAGSLSEALGAGPAAGLTQNFTKPYNNSAPETLLVNGMKEIDAFFQMTESDQYGNGDYGYLPPYRLKVVGDSLIIEAPRTNSILQVLKPSDFTVLDNGVVGATFSGAQGYSIADRVLLLGGKAVGLEYTNFGSWARRSDSSYSYSYYSPFVMESTSAAKKTPGAGAFTGTVLAHAYDGSDKKPQYLVGQANLNVSSAAAGDLALSFPNFYTLKTGLTIDGSGGITQNGAFTLSDAAKNATGINLADGGSGSVMGQFYGGSGAPAATEAVGTFSYNNSNSRGVKGSFGVKR